MIPWSRIGTPAVFVLALACGGGSEESAEPAPVPLDSLTAAEREAMQVDPLRYPEMQDGRLDTVDMRADTPDALWHVQAINYATEHIAITYTFGYVGPEPSTKFAADRQPRLVDNRGNVYEGMVVPDNPRLEIESGSTGVGVYVFRPGLVQDADSLSLMINDSTAPTLRIGPWGVVHTPPSEGGIGIQPGG